MPIMHGIGTSRCCALKRDQRWMLYVLPYWEPAGMLEAGWELKRPCPHYSKPFLRQGHVVCCTGRFRALFSPGPDRALLLPAGGGSSWGGRRPRRSGPIAISRLCTTCSAGGAWPVVVGCVCVCVYVYGRNGKPQPEGVKKKKKLACHRVCSKVLARTAYRPVVPLALAIACMRRTTISARIQGRTGERVLLSTATYCYYCAPPWAAARPDGSIYCEL